MPTLTLDMPRLVRRIFWSMISAQLLIFLGDILINHLELSSQGAVQRFFNVTREDSFGSWFGVTQTLLMALTLWLVHFLTLGDARQERPRQLWRRYGWLVLALLFSYMAMDDGAMFHERVGTLFEVGGTAAASDSLWHRTVRAFPTYLWQLVFLPFFGFMGLFALFFLWKEVGTERRRLLVFFGLGLFGAAVVLDFVEGMRPEHPWNPLRSLRLATGWQTATVEHLCRAVEETIEMTGMTFLWTAVLAHLGGKYEGFTVELRGP